VILNRASEKDKTALLIEGDKDGRVYRKVTDPRYCRPFPSHNRAVAEEALAILKSAAQRGVLAIVDADTDYLADRNSKDPDLLVTHTRDSEGILLQSQALRNVLIEFDIDGVFGTSPELAVISAVAPIGYVRFVAEQNRWNVRISRLDFAKFIDPPTLRCDTKRLCKHIADLTIGVVVTARDYQAGLSALMARGIDACKVARGHDATALLAWAIPLAAGKKKKHGAFITAEVVESYLRTAYPEDAFAKCELYQKIEQWEYRNIPYKVLKR
jgi:hypothetical protein